MVSSRDIQEIIEKLSSDKAKAREDGAKLLNTWLEGERSVRFCKYMAQNTSKLKPSAIPHSETWPFLVSLLIQCVSAEISNSKRRLPKATYAKTLRIVIQRAEDAKYSDKTLPLLAVVKSLFNHVWDVVSNVPSFQSEYGIILRHLLAVRDYRFHLRKRIYSSLLLLYIEKVEAGLGGKSNVLSNPKEEVFRSILTLQSLLENPPGDFPGDVREEIVKGFVQIFASVREESKISRKLIECINTYLLKDGPNLGSLSLEIHNALQQFVFQCWLTTHDKGLKDAIIFYARLQLSLTRGVTDGNSLVEQLMDVICRELDQGSLAYSVPWTDSSKDDKLGTLSTSQCGFVELAALVLYKACANTVRAPSTEKRVKREHITVVLKEALVKGKWLWNAAFCCLINRYYSRMSKDLFMYCFEGISTNFERILADANMQHSYDGLLWTLRSLQELSAVLLLSDSREHISSGSCFLNSNELGCGWHLVWRCLMQGLPTFSSFTTVVDAALLLIGNIASHDLVSACVVPNDIWDLKPFKRVSSMSVLYFIACHFAQKGSQSDLRESLHLRRNLLRAILGNLNLNVSFDSSTLNDHMVLLLPGAVYSLCAGCVPFALSHRGLFSLSFLDTSEPTADGLKADEADLRPGELFECSVDVLARTDSCSLSEVSLSLLHQSVRLPKELKDPLLNDLETYILEFIEEKQIRKNVSDIFYMCALLSNLIYGSLTARKREDVSSFISKMRQYLLELLDDAVTLAQEHCVDLQSSLLAAFRSFVCSPMFDRKGGQYFLDIVLHDAISQSLERLLKALSKLYVQFSECASNYHSEVTGSGILASDALLQVFDPIRSDGSRIVDMELDLNGDTKEVDLLTAGGKIGSGKCCSTLKWKLGMISLISSFVSVLDLVTWDVLFDLYQNECDTKVREDILYHLCKHFTHSSSSRIANLVQTMDRMFEMQSSVKLNCFNAVTAVDQLLHSLLSLDTVLKDSGQTSKKQELEPSLIHLGDIVNKFSDVGLLDWVGRVRLVDCICNFVLLSPQISQTMIERLFVLLQDPDYRVRFSLAQRIGVLFQTWDGHVELFQDICSNFGIELVQPFEGKLVTAKEVLAGDPQPPTRIETTVVTLMHLALHSEKIEAMAVFMMCVISALDPSQRELVIAVLDHLSRRLHYQTRFKYLDELSGPVLFCWISCGVSLVSLLEIRQHFVSDAEPAYFIQYCCHWLLPALILHDDNHNLMWVAKVANQPLAVLLRSNFIPIFSVCMALYCSKKSGREKASFILQSSILQLAEMSENERDKMIKKHMVAIVNHILSLTSCASDPGVPFFARETIGRAIQTVVDGFLEMDSYPTTVAVVDKINIFRPDRVFMFIVEMHYKIEAAVHHRHKCRRLAGIEVLIDILGRRAAVSSTYNYLLNLIGQFIGCEALQNQCCRLMSALIKTFKENLSEEVVCVLGEQLQFLVSKLVACCFPSETAFESPGSKSSEFSSLLVQLTMESDLSLYDYVKELETFPDIGMFAGIRKFHQELCQTYSPREHLLKVVKRSCHLPPRLLMSSIQALHKKLLMEDGLLKERFKGDSVEDTYWHHDPEMTQAVWTLVRMCGSDDADHIRPLVSDFVSRVGIGDPYRVVFHLPGDSAHSNFFRPITSDNTMEISFKMDSGISEELLVALLKLLKKFLMDDSVRIVDIASQTLRGILSTEMGQRAILLFDSYERSLIEIHSKGVNIELVEKLLLDKEMRFKTESSSLEDSSLWETLDKTFERWICPLVHALIGYSTDVILRLCQDIVLLKPEVAELLLPSVIVDLASRKETDVDLYRLISLKVQENILTNANKLTKSIQVFLNALNELRLCYVMNRASIVPSKRESTKYAKPSSYGSKSHSSSARGRETVIASNAMAISTSSWDKVYWLTIDYLVVAKSAVTCGSYFTAIMYVEYWCEENFGGLMLGSPDFSHNELLPDHIEILVSAVTQINEPDSLYGITQSHKLTSQVVTFEHEGNWSKALEYYDLLVRSNSIHQMGDVSRNLRVDCASPSTYPYFMTQEDDMRLAGPYKGLIRSLQQMGCTHVLDLYCQGFTSRKSQFQHDLEFTELQYEAAWRAGNWDFSLLSMGANSPSHQHVKTNHFNENLHSCLRALQEGDYDEFHKRLKGSKQELVWSVSCASKESTEYIYSAIVKLQILYHLGMAWHIRWTAYCGPKEFCMEKKETFPEPVIPTMEQLSWLNADWNSISERTQLNMNLLEPFIAFRRVLLQILGCSPCTMQHLLHSTSALRKGSRFSQAAATLHEFKFLCAGSNEQSSSIYLLGRLEEAKLLRAQSQHEMAISLAKYISENCCPNKEASDVHRLVGKWLAETRSSNSRTILEKYLKPAVALADNHRTNDMKCVKIQSQAHFQLARYADALFRSYEERLTSNEWQAAMRLRKHKTMELEALVKRLRSSAKGEQADYSVKIQELQRQLAMDREEAEKMQDDRDNFLSLALEAYKRCLVIGDKYDMQVVFRLVSLWFSLSARQSVIVNMHATIDEVQSYKFVPLVYQIASRLGSSKDGVGPHKFQLALISLLKKMAIDHPYHTIFQLLALENGDRIKDKQRSRNSFVVDVDKIHAAKKLLQELLSYHGAIIKQMRQMAEIYIKLAELETRREDTNKKIKVPREIRSVRQLELVPVVTDSLQVDRNCHYSEGSFPHFKGLADSVTVMNGINAPKVVECFDSDGRKYRQLAKSGNDDLRQDAVMEQFFGLVNTFLQNNRDTWKRRLGIRTYKVVPFTPSAGVLEWVNGTLPLGEYLIGSMRNGGAHGRYGRGDWSFLKCREHMSNEKDKRKAFQEVCENFRPVMHQFFLERFLQPADWFEKRLAYSRSLAASSMVGYIVGLGDRHSMNILIDQATAEVVHIDLGVAFEQGLMLKTPERVPFRLTRDVIDGMGVAGVEGVFRRCCEETLSVMRTNKEALLTIIEVFIHDPLYKWALSPLKALQLQKETDDDLEGSMDDSQDVYEGNKDAARALLRVKQKLDGYESGELRSAHGQVQQLIQDAIDPERLCQMFPGWGAWL